MYGNVDTAFHKRLFDLPYKNTRDADFLEGRGAFSSQFGISYKTPDTPDLLLQEGDVIMLGDITFVVIHTPGHTKDSLTLLLPDRILTGDVLFLDDGGGGRDDLPGGDQGEH